MSFIHIIVLFVLTVFIVASYFIAKEFLRESKISKEQDILHKLLDKKTKQLKEMNISLTMNMYLKILLCAPLPVGVLTFLISNSGPLSVLFAIISLGLPEFIARVMKADLDKKFESRYARSLEQLSSSFSAGMSISEAVEDVANCKFLHESMRKKYANLSSDLQMGLSVSEAFNKFAEGTNSVDAKDVAIAIDVQNEVGGHEAEVIKEVASNIHDRIMLRREIKSIFSGTSSMVWMMDFIPPLVVVWFGITNKEYVDTYFSSPTYLMLFIIFLVAMLIGSIINHSIIKRIMKGE